MGPFVHMRIHAGGNHPSADSTDTPRTPSTPAILTATAYPIFTNDNQLSPPDFSCPHCACNFTSRIGLVGYLRIHHRDTVEPVPGAPTYSRRTQLHCPHCSRIFTHRMGHMHLHDNLR
ncbi:unnamed protein product [Schistocephalus solidus]|uniref:C2H2-type domain-containing protein n=1 Tax=Schistocephalus solidus TaxID=70667 RepID=A0A183TU33_SCHSO|nr:unnamed protein product [Schistocephalus solidus]